MRTYKKKIVTINIGEVYVSKAPVVIYTLIGSCVAVCIYDVKNHIGGMNHVFFPGSVKRYPDFDNKNGENTMINLMRKMLKLSSDRENLIAKIFGGAHLISNISQGFSVGSQLFDYVEDFLNKEKIRIIAWDIRGTMARKVYFHTDTGNAFVKKMSRCRDFLQTYPVFNTAEHN